jgi:hypothetical protein
MQNHLSFEKIKDLAREYFLYPIEPSSPLWTDSETTIDDCHDCMVRVVYFKAKDVQ